MLTWGNRYILIIMEYLNRWSDVLLVSNIIATTLARAPLDKLIFPHGCPLHLLSIQGSQFRGEVMHMLTQSLMIKQLFTSPYHPQTNGSPSKWIRLSSRSSLPMWILYIRIGTRFSHFQSTHTTRPCRHQPRSSLSTCYMAGIVVCLQTPNRSLWTFNTWMPQNGGSTYNTTNHLCDMPYVVNNGRIHT